MRSLFRLFLLVASAALVGCKGPPPIPRQVRMFMRTAVRRFMHLSEGAANSKGLWSRYLRANVKFPVPTAIVTSAILWTIGDAISQAIERQTHPSPFDRARLLGTAIEGSVVGGGIGSLWYQQLDKIVHHKLKFKPGSAKFVLAKLGLECILWKPIVLLSFWVVVGLAECHSISKIKRELKNDFLPSLLSEYCVFAPLDLLNFLKVPVRFQVLVSNAESLLEAIGLSYIHEHGFPGFDGSIKEHPIISDRRLQIPLINRLVNSMLMPLSVQHARADFSSIDVDKRGYITTADLHERMDSQMLPGLRDPVASHYAAELLVRKADVNGDGKVSIDEYLRMVEALQRTNYREELLGDVVHALFDTDRDGYIDRSELGRCVAVLLGPKEAAERADEIMTKADVNRDGRLSREEMRRTLKALIRHDHYHPPAHN